MRATVLGIVLLLGGSAGADSVGARSHLPGRAARILGLSGWAASTAALALAIFSWQRYSSLQAATSRDLLMLEPTLRFNRTPEEEAFFRNPSCSPPSTIANTGVFRRDCDLGQQYYAATMALLVGTAAIGAVGTVIYVVGDSRAKRDRVRPVAVAPMLSPSFGGLVLRTEF